MSEPTTLIIILTAVSLSSIILRRFSMPLETIYIATGIILSPFLAGAGTTLFAEVGAVFLIFFTAMNIRIGPIRTYLAPGMIVIASHLIIMALTGYLGLRYGHTLYESFIIGLTCATGSSLLSIDVIEDQIDRRLTHGQMTEAITFLQDLLTVLLITLLAFWPHTTDSITGIGWVGLLFIAALLGRDHVRSIFSRLSSRVEATLLIGLSVLWAATALLHGFPYGTVIAPLVAGLLLSGHGENFTLLEAVRPLKDFFVPLFFVSLGTLVLATTGGLMLALGIFLSVTLVRPLVTGSILRWQGIEQYSSFRTAVQLDQVSELSLLLVLIFTAGGQIAPEVSHAIVLAAAASFITSSYTTHHADDIYVRLTDLIEDTSPQVKETGHTIVAGYGHLGRSIAPFLEDPIIIDNDPRAVQEAREDGYTAVKRDIHDPATWDHVNARAAGHIILTIPDDQTALQLADLGTDALFLTESPALAEQLDDRPGIRAYNLASLSSDRVLVKLSALLEDLETGA